MTAAAAAVGPCGGGQWQYASCFFEGKNFGDPHNTSTHRVAKKERKVDNNNNDANGPQ